MKNVIVIVAIAVICLMLLTPVTAFANSAQREFEGVASNGALVNETDCPIEVTGENLTFNIVDYPQVGEENPDYHSNVVAEYTFYNPADYDVNMQLVFPFGIIPYWVRDDYVDTDRYGVYVNDVKMERGIRAIYSDRDSKFNLNRDLARIVDTRKQIKQFADDTPVYKYSVKSQFYHNYAEEDIYKPFARYSTYGTAIVVADVQYYSPNDSSKFYAEIYGDKQMDIYSIGSTLSESFFQPSYYVGVSEKVEDYYAYVDKEIRGTTEYVFAEELTFEDLIFSSFDEKLGINKTDYYNAVADKISKTVFDNRANGLDSFDITNEALMWYQYDVSVPAGQSVTNKVVAPLYPTVDEYFNPTKYYYTYLLSPAASWADFKNLNVTVNTEYFLLDSSLNGFTRNVDNSYTAQFETLPDGELTFTLCQSLNPERENDNFWIFFIFLILFIIPLGLILLLLAIVIPIKVSRKRGKRMQKVEQTCTREQQQSAMSDYFNNEK